MRELAYARALTATLAQAAPQVVLSYPETMDGEPSAPSALIDPQAPHLAGDLRGVQSADIIASARKWEALADERAPAIPPGTIRGGAGIIAAQSDCPFRATALHRMRVEPWPEAAEGLNARGARAARARDDGGVLA